MLAGMKIEFDAVWRVLRKEIREATRDRNLVVNLVLVPVFLYPVLGFGAFQVMQIAQGFAEKQPTVVGVLGDVPGAVTDSLAVAENLETVVPPGDREAAFRARVPEAFRDWRLAAETDEEPAPDALLLWEARNDSAAVWFDRSRDRSIDAKETVLEAVDSWRRGTALEDMAAVGLGEADLEPWPIETDNTATATQIGRYALSLILPMILLLMLAMGTFYAALDAVVGERERGTLETLLVSPLRRVEFILGKYLWVLSASVLSLVLNLASMAVFLAFVLKLVDIGEDIHVGISPGAFGLILVTAILTAGFLSAVLMLLAVPARTYREGQATLTPAYLVTMIPGLVVATSSAPFDLKVALVPLLNSTALFEAALKGDAGVGPVAVTWIVLAVATIAVLVAATRVMSREDVYLENELSLRQLFGGRRTGGGR